MLYSCFAFASNLRDIGIEQCEVSYGENLILKLVLKLSLTLPDTQFRKEGK